MNAWIIVIGIITFLIFLIFSLKIYIKRKKKKEKKLIEDIPQEVLEVFNEAERRLNTEIQNGKKPNPHKILWEISGGRKFIERDTGVEKDKPISSTGKLPTVPPRKQDVQIRTTTTISGNKNRTIESSGNSNRNFFSRFRRKNS